LVDRGGNDSGLAMSAGSETWSQSTIRRRGFYHTVPEGNVGEEKQLVEPAISKSKIFIRHMKVTKVCGLMDVDDTSPNEGRKERSPMVIDIQRKGPKRGDTAF